MLGSDLTAAGGQGTMDQFNVGAALVRGVEALLSCDPMPHHWLVRVNTQLSYTYTDTKMKNDFTSSAWGDVHAGDEIPYIFKHSSSLHSESNRLLVQSKEREQSEYPPP